MVEELAVHPQACLWPDLFEKQAVAPSGVGNDDIRVEASGAQLDRRSQRCLGPHYLGLQVANPGVDAGRAAPAQAVLTVLDRPLGPGSGPLHCQGHDPVGGVRGQRRRQKLELARKVLVHEEATQLGG